MNLFNGKETLSLLAGITLLILSGCFPSEPDTTTPAVSLGYPPDSSIVGDSVMVKASGSDNIGIGEVRFYINGSRDSLADGNSVPYEYMWNVRNDSLNIGQLYTLYVIAEDQFRNGTISNFVHVYYQWKILIRDGSDPMERDIDRLFGRSSEDRIEFRLHYNEEWDKAHTDPDDGLNTALFFDTDHDTTTGLYARTAIYGHDGGWMIGDTLHYHPNTIGADYMVTLGQPGDSLWRWDPDANNWSGIQSLEFTNIPPDTNILEFGLRKSSLGSPQSLDIVVGNQTSTADTILWDWAPDTSHISYQMEDAYLGNSDL